LAGALLKPEGRLLLFGSRSSGALRKLGDFRAIDELDLAGGESILQVLGKTG
jgi:hypothetical protein